MFSWRQDGKVSLISHCQNHNPRLPSALPGVWSTTIHYHWNSNCGHHTHSSLTLAGSMSSKYKFHKLLGLVFKDDEGRMDPVCCNEVRAVHSWLVMLGVSSNERSE